MGQYWMVVNLDKREFVDPHKLGSGLKLWEQLANHPGTGTALIVLCAAMPEVRGGGDLDLDRNWHGPERTFPEHGASPGPMPEDYPAIARRTIGRWAGDRIALVGDYAEDGDLQPQHQASVVYSLCGNGAEVVERINHYETLAADPTVPSAEATVLKARAALLRSAEPYHDVSEDVARVIEHELGGRYVGTGWRQWKQGP